MALDLEIEKMCDSTLMSAEGGEEGVKVEWNEDASANRAIDGYLVWVWRTMDGSSVMKVIAEKEGAEDYYYYSKLLDKQALVEEAGFYERMEFSAMAQMIEAAIAGGDDQLTMTVLPCEKGTLLIMRITQVMKYGKDIEHRINLDRFKFSQLMVLQRKVRLLQEEQDKDKDRIAELMTAEDTAWDTITAQALEMDELTATVEEQRRQIVKLEKQQDKDRETIVVLKQENEELKASLADNEDQKKEDDGDGSEVEVLTLSGLVCQQTWKGHSDDVNSVSISVDGRIAVSAR